MRFLLGLLPAFALAASCSEADVTSSKADEMPLCTPAEAGAAASAKAAELLAAVKRSDRGNREAACTAFREVLEDGSRAGIPDAPACRWDSANSNGNPRFLVSLHLTQLKRQAGETCGKLD
jgi:hypothetical protein